MCSSPNSAAILAALGVVLWMSIYLLFGLASWYSNFMRSIKMTSISKRIRIPSTCFMLFPCSTHFYKSAPFGGCRGDPICSSSLLGTWASRITRSCRVLICHLKLWNTLQSCYRLRRGMDLIQYLSANWTWTHVKCVWIVTGLRRTFRRGNFIKFVQVQAIFYQAVFHGIWEHLTEAWWTDQACVAQKEDH